MSITEIRVRKKAVIQPEPYNSQEVEVGMVALVGPYEDYEQVKANLIAEVNETFILEAEPIIDALDSQWKRDKWRTRLGAAEPEVIAVSANPEALRSANMNLYLDADSSGNGVPDGDAQEGEHHEHLDQQEDERDAQEHFEAHYEGGIGGSYGEDEVDQDTQQFVAVSDSGIPIHVLKTLREVRDSARTNMLDVDAVVLLVNLENGAAADWLRANPDHYMDALNEMGSMDTDTDYEPERVRPETQ